MSNPEDIMKERPATPEAPKPKVVSALVVGLQKKKNQVRADIATKGFLKKGGLNTFDKYEYFSEAQYKELFTDLFSKHGIEFFTSVMSVEEIQGTSGMPYGRRVCIMVTLTDIDNVEEREASTWYGEAFDKTDKALYKAYTGALKYFLANTFHVATGDDPEADKRQPDAKEEAPKAPEKILPWHVKVIKNVYNTPELVAKFCEVNGVKKIEDLTYDVGLAKVNELNERANAKKAQANAENPAG